MTDWHVILGVAKNSSLEQIKAAYRKKAFEFHPDKNPSPDAQSQFIAIDTAYRMLTNPGSIKFTKPRPPRKKDIWDVDVPVFKDSMDGQYEHQKKYQPYYDYNRPRYQPYKAPEPPAKLYWGDNDMTGYWAEYNRLKIVCAYEEPEVFWQKLDEWVVG